jgi:hypothetical protein
LERSSTIGHQRRRVDGIQVDEANSEKNSPAGLPTKPTGHSQVSLDQTQLEQMPSTKLGDLGEH